MDPKLNQQVIDTAQAHEGPIETDAVNHQPECAESVTGPNRVPAPLQGALALAQQALDLAEHDLWDQLAVDGFVRGG